MLGEKFGHFCLNRLRQQGARPVTQHLGERIGERPWLKQLHHVSIGHGVSLLCWRSGGANTPTIRRLLPLSPSPTSANSSAVHPSLEARGRNGTHAMAGAPSRRGTPLRRCRRISWLCYQMLMPRGPSLPTSGTRCRRAACDGG